MKTSTAAITGLVVVLIVSNTLWAYYYLPMLTALNYGTREWELRGDAIEQSLELVRAFTRSESSREQLIAAAQRRVPAVTPQERSGYEWVGSLGLQFNEAGQLSNVVYWIPPE